MRCVVIRGWWLAAVWCVWLSVAPAGAEEPASFTSLRVMSFNLWHGGDAGQQPLAKTIEVITAAKADVVGLQETAGIGRAGEARPDRAAEIAKALGWHYLDQGGRTGVVSRFPIVASTPRKWGVKLSLPDDQAVWVFNAHFAHAPYQPYQLLGIPYANAPFLKSAEEAIVAARAARGGQVERMLGEIAAVREKEEWPVFVTGDFNEPSHLDWTAAAHEAKRCPVVAAWPTTQAVTEAGFVDAYRVVLPDPVAHPGHTWTPLTKPDDPADRHDRIDFVFVARGAGRVIDVAILGEAPEYADQVIKNYPSDHRAVVAEVLLP